MNENNLQTVPSESAKSSLVLVVDDEEVVRRVLAKFLRNMGHTALVAEDGVEALAKLSPEVDLIYLDCELPGADGVELTRLIREQQEYAAIPIIMISGHGDRSTRIRALAAGVNDFLTKPFDTVELRLRTDTLLQLKHSRETLEQQRANLESLVAERSAAVNKALGEVERQRDQLRQAHQETLDRLALAAEYKDRDTASHIHRVGGLCALLAQRWGCEPDEVELIRMAAPLHDVGKLGIPDDILMAPRRLTPEEREIMEGHAEIGARILGGSDSEVLRAAEEIARAHHEWWDGSGYPRGLRGEEIPLPGRITAVADVFDALTSRRPYKKAFTNDESLDIMRKGRGTQFQTELFDLLESLMDDVLEIQKEHSAGDGARGGPSSGHARGAGALYLHRLVRHPVS